MSSVAAGLRYTESVVFVALALLTARQWVRRRDRASGSVALAFGVLGVVLLVGFLLPRGSQSLPVIVADKLLVGGLLAFPYLLYRFMTSFEPSPRWLRALTSTLTAATVLATLLVPRFPAPGVERTGFWLAYLWLVLAQWTVLTSAVSWRLWRAGRTLPRVARRRAQALSAGSAMTAAAVALAVLAPHAGRGSVGAAALSLIGIASALLFLAGLVPNRWLLRVWRAEDGEALQAAMAGLLGLRSERDVANALLPHAVQLAGARGALLTDAGRQVIGVAGETHSLSGGSGGTGTALLPGVSQLAPGLLRVELDEGSLDVWTSPYTPFFGQEDLALLHALGSVVQVALSRARAYQREVAARADLAQAQRVAQLGSWRWDARTGRLQWSEEMYRIYGRSRIDHHVRLPDYLSLLHPEDFDRVNQTIKAAVQDAAPYQSEHRIVRADGTVRWVQDHGVATTEAAGQLTGLFGTSQDVTERHELQEQLTRQARHDPLTGLPNRMLFSQRLQEASRPSWQGSGPAVLFVDVDRFKLVNDSLGHDVGDRVLVELAERLQHAVGPEDTVARFGGDEFIVLCPGATDAGGAGGALAVADRIRCLVSRPLTVAGVELVLTASVGVSIGRRGAETDLVQEADSAVYQAKSDGRGRTVVFSEPMHRRAVGRLALEIELRRALVEDQFVVYYQPVVDLRSGDVVGVEALARWQHPHRGLLAPAEFIPVAEDCGLIVQIGELVLARACEQIRSWAAPPGLTMAVNLSAVQFGQVGIERRLADVIADAGLDPSCLIFEITETILMNNVEETLRVLRALRGIGVRVAVDDFGTGYSSLAYLKRFPLDTLKIDRSFLERAGTRPDDFAIVEAIRALAGALGMDVIAEGVEDEVQLRLLQSLRCQYGQGFLFGEAVPGADLSALFAGRVDFGDLIGSAPRSALPVPAPRRSTQSHFSS